MPVSVTTVLESSAAMVSDWLPVVLVADTVPVTVYWLVVVLQTPGVAVAVSEQTGSAAVVMVSGATAEQFLLSVTVTVKEAVPLVVGVPEMTPVVGFKLSPVGKLPAEIMNVAGAVAPEVVRVCEYAVPTCPLASIVVVKLREQTVQLGGAV